MYPAGLNPICATGAEPLGQPGSAGERLAAVLNATSKARWLVRNHGVRHDDIPQTLAPPIDAERYPEDEDCLWGDLFNGSRHGEGGRCAAHRAHCALDMRGEITAEVA